VGHVVLGEHPPDFSEQDIEALRRSFSNMAH
jgi:hypothetical protein